MKTLVLFTTLLLFSSHTFGQKENQLSTSQEGIFIEQNTKGQYGIVNDKGEVLVPIVNEYIKELWQGTGFIVYEKIVTNGPDYKTGVLRFYDSSVKDVFERTFTRISGAGKNHLICFEDELCGVYSKDGNVLAPLCFNEINSLDGKLFWFDAKPNLRTEMENILTSKDIPSDKASSGTSNSEQNASGVFQGMFKHDGTLLCKGDFRMVEIIRYEGESSLFAVQNQQQFIDNDGAANFAIMNGSGELISEFVYSEVFNIDGQLIGEIQTETSIEKVPLNNQGRPAK
jgi:hypothetical protein